MRTLQSTHAARKRVLKRDDAHPEDSKPVVLLMVARAPPPEAVVDRALWVARGLRARLRTVVALPRRSARSADTAAVADDIVCSHTSLREAAIATTRQHPVAMIVVAPGSGGDGAGAVSLCDALRIPVLVARASHASDTIVAATDVTHVPTADADRPLEAAKLACLRWLAAGDDNVSIMLARAASPLAAIVEVARQADLVAVGVLCRSRVGRWFRRGFAQQVVDRCGCSVLLVPVAL